MRPTKPRYRPSGFVVARTPLLPVDAWRSWCEAAPSRATDLLRAHASSPLVREALHLGSRSLSEAVTRWGERGERDERDANDDRGEKVPPALGRYLARIATRCTPFATLATVTPGSIGDRTRCELAAAAESRRHLSIDADVLEEWALRIASEHRDRFVWWPNPSLRRTGAGYRFLVRAPEPHRWTSGEREVGRDRAVDLLLEQASAGLRLPKLRKATRALADQLIDLQLFVCELSSLARASDLPPDEVLRLRLGRAGLTEHARHLEEVQAELGRERDAPIGRATARYDAIEARAPWGSSPWIHVDALRPGSALTISTRLADELCALATSMARIQPPALPFARLLGAWVARYGDREVPLLEATDGERGIFVEMPELVRDPASDPRRTETLLRKVEDLRAGPEFVWHLSPEDLAALAVGDEAAIPSRIELLVMLSASSSSEPVAVMYGGSGIQGSLLGRFARLDPELERRVREHVVEDDATVCFADVDALPGARMGNTIARARLHAYCITIGAGGDDRDALPFSDLLVQHDRGRLRLISATRRQEIVPRLTHSHRFWAGSPPPAYRLLCHLARQPYTSGLSFAWGPLARARRLPRVMLGRHVVSVAQWTFTRAELLGWTTRDPAARRSAIEDLRARYAIPRHVLIADGDNRLTVDLESDQSVASARTALGGSELVLLQEAIGVADATFATGPEGGFVCELVVPMRLEPRATRPTPRPVLGLRDTTRRHPMGQRWTVVKLYARPSHGDRVLLGVIRPVARSGTAGLRWFFERARDPDEHVKLVLRTTGRAATERVLRTVLRRCAALEADGTLVRSTIEGYAPALETFGGPDAMAAAETVAWRDSEAVLQLLADRRLDLAHDSRQRWLAQAIAFDRFVTAVAPADRLGYLELARAGALEAVEPSDALEPALSRAYRASKHELDAVLEGPDSIGRRIRTALALRDEVIAKETRSLLARAGARSTPHTFESTWAIAQDVLRRLARTRDAESELAIVDGLLRRERSLVARLGAAEWTARKRGAKLER